MKVEARVAGLVVFVMRRVVVVVEVVRVVVWS